MKVSPALYGFGSACVDYRIHIPDMGEGYTAKVLADEVNEFGGGACANCLVQAARLGADCTYLGKLGNDPQSVVIKSLFKSENIKTELIEAGKGTLSPFNIAVYKGDSNERVGGYLLPNALGSITPREAATLAQRMEQGCCVMVEIGEIPLESVLAFTKAALQGKARIFMDVDLDPVRQLGSPLSLFEETIGLADVLIPNYEAVKYIYDSNDRGKLASMLSDKFNNTVIVTAGADGVYYCEPSGRTRHMAAGETKIVDTVGAGDSFHGSLMYALGAGMDMDDAVTLAMKCAQTTCTGFGARTSMPYLNDI